MKYFKVKIGYGANEFISVDETELPMAMRAMINGKVGSFKEGAVAGKSIMAITPDWNKVMGYNRDCQLTGEDYNYIGDKRVDEYRDFIASTKLEVEKQLLGGQNLLN